jgi:hypothetical protein
MAIVRRKCFISYHHADQYWVTKFINDFDHVHDTFISRGLGEGMTDEIINSANTEYVMRRIRERFLKDSTVTIVLMGRCTWARRYVDWEIQASLRQGETSTPNGLLGVKLPTFTYFPDRFNRNLVNADAGDAPGTNFAFWIEYPSSTQVLIDGIEYCYARRVSHSRYIENPRERMSYNRTCN